ncbi:S-adenosyl-L-methionine-dependent methyltransferase [Dacryopinax primogenitus]|uniref:S-adenosyl-L-methionine-dependent methyltransferase n=1 Tax=Dacryopinax primogenitus (strain DJM 731) TaxID=1858805 RepID=M5FXZ7_DACPD|nr:S-adenosyl-L-methionine-dependent methyltransferase [Dacryopinax primogenitus]EJT98426.1 S-adenosyl-L-methionine-dependent methyltransferase [Dacryopinax primogenitus]
MTSYRTHDDHISPTNSPSPSPSLSPQVEYDDMIQDDDGYYDSDVERAPSVYSYASSRDGPRLVREVHGRVCNAQNELYALPADEEECTRISTQHLMLKLALSSNYPAPQLVKDALRPAMSKPFFPGLPRRTQERRRQLLDCGTGAGEWAVEMALEFPEVDVVGVDLAPQFRKKAANAPKNCRFEIDDVTLGMPHFKGTFDVVHSRSIGNGVQDFPAYIEDLLLTLRPGGILIMCEGDLQLLSNSGPVDPLLSPLQRLLSAAYGALKAKGSTVDAGRGLAKWLKALQGRRGGTSAVGSHVVWVPVGGWLPGTDPQSQHLNNLGHLMAQDCQLFLRSLRPTLLEAGYDPLLLDSWVLEAESELARAERGEGGLWCLWHYAYVPPPQP